jgi:hypothetical protein
MLHGMFEEKKEIFAPQIMIKGYTYAIAF